MLVAALCAVAVPGLLKLKVDTAYDSLIGANDPGYPVYEETIDTFGSDNTTIVYLRHDDLFDPERLTVMEDLHYAFEEIEGVETVKSLFNAMNIRDRDGELDTEALMDEVPETAEDAGRVKDNAIYSPLVRQNFISEDGKVAAINVTVYSEGVDSAFNVRVHDDIQALLDPVRDNFDEVFQVGPPRLNVEIENSLFADMQSLTPFSTAILIGSIILFLRTVMAAGLPMGTAGISLVWTFGFMGYTGIPINLLTAILPSLVIVIGSTEDTHMLACYLDGVREKTGDRKAAIRLMARHVGLPIFITSFTTAVGFLTNAISDIALIKDFAYATSFAMISNLVATVLVLPLLLALFGPRKARIAATDGSTTGIFNKVIGVMERVTDNHQGAVALVTAALILVLGYNATLVKVSNDPLSYFKSDNQIIADADTLHDDLSGMQVFYMTVTAPPGSDFKDPEQLRKLAEVIAFMKNQGVYDKVVSIVDHLSLVNREMHQADPSFFTVPETRELVEQYLLLFQRSDLENYLSGDATKVNVVVRHNLSDSSVLNGYLAKLGAEMDRVFGDDMDHLLTGKNLLINRAAESLFSNQVESLGLLVIIIFVIMSALYTSPTAGVLSLIPNMIPVVFVFGIMGIAGIPLNPGTATVAVIAVGIAIDDTIHLLTRYNDECKIEPDHIEAARKAVRAEAIPVISTSVALAAGFGVLVLSNFQIVAQFGVLAAMTMLCAMVSDLMVTPILLRRLRLVGLWDIVSLKVGEEVLTKSPLFEGMTKFQIRKTILLSTMHEYKKGDIIIRQGTRGEALYLILSGDVEVFREEKDGSETHFADVPASQVIGEVGFVRETERSATVRALDDVQILELEGEKTANAMRFYPWLEVKLNRNISRILAARLAEMAVTASTRWKDYGKKPE